KTGRHQIVARASSPAFARIADTPIRRHTDTRRAGTPVLHCCTARCSKTSTRTIRLFRAGAEGGEAHAWRRFSTCHTLKIRLRLKSEPAGIGHRRERTDMSVVALNGSIEITSRHSDPILGSFDLRLEIAKIIVRSQLWIVLADCEQAAERSCQRVLSLFVLA